MKTEIVEGMFGQVSGGNCTTVWMVDGPDLEDRARAAWEQHGGYYGGFYPSMIKARGVAGFGVVINDSPYVTEVFKTREAAERCIGGAA